ncbi:hypothetical protein K439DRAFT_1657365 [Ramaria rubella]|nr:hypothetical protein K439DRAFT_1657365 [Ramaria rubella]
MEEVDGNMILDSRLRNRSKKSIFAHNLERLQRRRKGQVSDTASADEEDDTTGSESSHSAPSVTSQYFEGAHPMHPSNDSDDQDQNEAEDDFIVEDDDAENIPELPTMFSMGTFQDFSHHFKVICQLFVHLATHDPHRRPSWMKQALGKNYFSVPLAISRRKLSGMRDSLVASSVWKADFKNRLETFPVFHLEQLEFAIPICDACHLGNRVATLRGVLSGCEYDPLTYEVDFLTFSISNDIVTLINLFPIQPRDKIEEKENEHDAVEFNLGRFCATRVHVFHSFTHWEHILYHSLREEIDRLKEAAICNESRGKARAFIPATNGPPPPDDLEDADGMMDWLDGRGIINAEWIRMKEMMERARKLEARGGEERLNLEG